MSIIGILMVLVGLGHLFIELSGKTKKNKVNYFAEMFIFTVGIISLMSGDWMFAIGATLSIVATIINYMKK